MNGSLMPAFALAFAPPLFFLAFYFNLPFTRGDDALTFVRVGAFVGALCGPASSFLLFRRRTRWTAALGLVFTLMNGYILLLFSVLSFTTRF